MMAQQVDDRMKFILSAAAGALGVSVTLIFIPEITSLDLKEGDIRWDLIKKGAALSPNCIAICHFVLRGLPSMPACGLEGSEIRNYHSARQICLRSP